MPKKYKTYDDIPQHEIDDEIRQQAQEAGVSVLLAVPGVWELVAEEFNNSVLAHFDPDVEAAAGDEDLEQADIRLLPDGEEAPVCETCDGDGRMADPVKNTEDHGDATWMKCTACDGSGFAKEDK